MGISIEVKNTSIESSKLAAEIVKEVLINPKTKVIGLATGSSVIRLYNLLVKAYKLGEIDFL